MVTTVIPITAYDTHEKFATLWGVIGDTPMMEIGYTWHGIKRSVFIKCEYSNLTGSIKDRVALYLLERAYRKGQLQPGSTIVEVTGGNMGISFAAIARRLGFSVKALIPQSTDRERVEVMQSFGTDVTLVSGGIANAMKLAESMASENDQFFLPHRYSSTLNAEVHEQTTGAELWTQLTRRGIKPDAFVSCTGTGATLTGFAKYLKRRNNTITVHPVEVSEDAHVLPLRNKFVIPGLTEPFLPNTAEACRFDESLYVQEGDAIHLGKKLAGQLGLYVGLSSAINFLGAVAAQNRLGDDARVATVFCDTHNQYLDPALVSNVPVRDNFFTPHIEFDGCKTLGRLTANHFNL